MRVLRNGWAPAAAAACFFAWYVFATSNNWQNASNHFEHIYFAQNN
jgi:hypothetical protein